MKKAIYNINRPYIFDPAHKGAPYSLNDGENWTNGGKRFFSSLALVLMP